MVLSLINTFLLFFLSFIIFPFGITFEVSKVIVFEIATATALVFKIFQFKSIKEFNFLHLFLTGTLFILSLISLVLHQITLFGNIFRLQGVFLFWLLLIFSLISSSIKLPKNINFIAQISVIILLLSSLILGVDVNSRAFGFLGEPNALAATAVFLFPFVWFNQKLKIRILNILLVLTIILLSQSRSGLIAVGLELFFITLIYKFKLSLKKSLILCLVVLGLTYSLPFLAGGGWYENRAEVWQTAFLAGLQSPLMGWGFGNIESSLHQTSLLLHNNIQYQRVDSSHNLFLDFWIQGGIFGVGIIISLIYLSFKGLTKQKKLLELTAFLGLLICFSFNPVSVVNLIAFWWLIGQGFSDF